MASGLRRWVIDRGGLLALACLVVYIGIAPSHLSTGDNAEFAGLGAMGGAAHPTGYPLYVLWLRAWSWLPVDTPAQATAIATAILGATSVLVLHAACRAWGASSSAASFAVALVASTPLVVRLSSEAEVFALNGLVAGAVLWLAAADGPLRGVPRAAVLGLVAGLGIANHLTCVLLAPVGVYGVVLGAKESPRGWGAGLAAAVGGLLLGLVPYAYLLVAPETRGSWGKVEGLSGLLHHVLRMDYGGPGELSAQDGGGSPVANLGWLARTLGRGYVWAPFALGLATLFATAVRPSPRRTAWILLAVSWLLAGPVLMARFNLEPEGAHAFITQRFHMLPLVVLAVPVAVGLHWIGVRASAHVSSTSLRRPGVLSGLALVSMLGLQAVALPRIASERSPAIEASLEHMLRTLPPDAVVIGTPEEYMFGSAYLQGARGERPDVLAITWQLIGLPHVRERIHRETGVLVEKLPEGSPQKLSVVVAEKLLATGRPLFIDPFQSNIAKSFPLYPYGLLYRVLPRGAAVPPIAEVFAINKALYERFELDYPRPHVANVVGAHYHERHAATWRALAEGLASAGLRDEAEYAAQLAFALAPVQ